MLTLRKENVICESHTFKYVVPGGLETSSFEAGLSKAYFFMSLDVRNSSVHLSMKGHRHPMEMCVMGTRPETRDRVVWGIGDG